MKYIYHLANMISYHVFAIILPFCEQKGANFKWNCRRIIISFQYFSKTNK